jgi:hypothetical protein
MISPFYESFRDFLSTSPSFLLFRDGFCALRLHRAGLTVPS